MMAAAAISHESANLNDNKVKNNGREITMSDVRGGDLQLLPPLSSTSSSRPPPLTREVKVVIDLPLNRSTSLHRR
ncbi:hypothetical protein CsSME_00022792 [Camellia sinensis var. sinensis]